MSVELKATPRGGGPSAAAAAAAPPTRIDVLFTAVNVATTLAAVVLPFYFHSPSAIVAFLVSYTLCGLGLTVGYHRLFAHRSYAVPKWLEYAIAICGYLAIQRGPIFWVAMHRLHHRYSDIPGKDPHTPKEGIWHVHFGWIQARRDDVWDPEVYRRLVPDLVDDPLYRWMDRESHDYFANFALIAASFLAGGLIGAGFTGFALHNAIAFAVWVGLLNRVALLQAFGLINSVCHLFGTRPYRSKRTDLSTNNLLVALVIFGEGWHNNHHAFPSSARHGLRWYQLDVAWYVIWLLSKLGLARNVKVPNPVARSRKTRLPAAETG